MPQFHITSAPSQISQMITEAALIQNLSTTATVYLDVESSVSSNAYSVQLGPKSALTWQADKPLWAVTESGTEADLTVMYGAGSTALGEVTVVGDVTITGPVTVDGTVGIDGTVNVAGNVNIDNVVQTQTEVTNTVTTSVTGTVDTVVTGPVDINGTVPIEGDVGITGPVTVTGAVDASGSNVSVTGDVNVGTITNTVSIDGTVDIALPVNVQGGGELLFDQELIVPPNTTDGFQIPSPPSGVTYYGLRFEITKTQGFTVDTVTVRDVDLVIQNSTAVTFPWTSGFTVIGTIGDPSRHVFTIPTLSTFPYFIEIANTSFWPSGTEDSHIRVRVWGVSAVEPFPRTDFTWTLDGDTASITFGTVAANSRLYLPSSYQDYWLKIRTTASGGLSGVDLCTQSATATEIVQDTEWQTDSAVLLPANTNSVVKVPAIAGTAPYLKFPSHGGATRISWAGVNPP